MLHTFFLAARASLVRNTSRSVAQCVCNQTRRNYGSRVYQKNALTESGTQGKIGQEIFIHSGVHRGMWADIRGITKQQYHIDVKGYRLPATYGVRTDEYKYFKP